MRNKIIISTVTGLLAFQAFMPFAMAGTLPVRAYAGDTVAGYPTALRTSILSPDQEVVFVVEGPDGAVSRVPATADLDGIAEAEFFGHQTKRAGEYRVAVTYPDSTNSSPQTVFKIHADQVSPSQSTITVSNPMVTADSESKTFVTVTLYDAYRNPIEGHAVKLISSRSEDKIEALGDTTDTKGQSNFKVTSDYPGLSVFTALDATVNAILSEREEIVFQSPAPKAPSASLFGASLFNADTLSATPAVPTGPVDRFVIEGLPATVKPSEQLNLTIIARDKDGNTSKNYSGTVLFAAPNDENAVLPGNGQYTFKESDQGQFTFNLALQFTKLGKQTLQVFDKDNWNIAGEAEVTVVSDETVPAPTATSLAIKSPADGAELGSPFVVISGKGEPNVNLKIFDNDAKIGDSQTDGDGFFSFDARGLESGEHSFYIMSNQGDISPAVRVLIDTLPPVLRSFHIAPEGAVAPGTALSVTLQSEPDLDGAFLRLQGMETPLARGFDPGTYEGTLTAPAVPGNFPVDVILTDPLGNKAQLLNQGMIQVALPVPAAPPQVEGLLAEAGDATVTLRFTPVAVSENPIAHYRVHFGTHFDELNQVKDTEGPSTEVLIGDLVNGTQYFFSVKAVDNKNTESEMPSVTVAATPVAPVPVVPPVPVAPVGDYRADAFNGGAQLSWPAFPDAQAFYYKIYFGVQSGQYDDFIVTQNGATAVTVHDLINGVPYFFRVAALDMTGNEISALSPEFSTVPNAVLRPAAPSPLSGSLGRVPRSNETGPESLWVVAISFAAAAFFYRHKRRLVR